MEMVVFVRPIPKFSRVLREPGLQGKIWCIVLFDSVWVSQSVPAIARAMARLGCKQWASNFYRLRGKCCCKNADELNAALEFCDGAFFVVRDPDNWEIECPIENATTNLGERDSAGDGIAGSAG